MATQVSNNSDHIKKGKMEFFGTSIEGEHIPNNAYQGFLDQSKLIIIAGSAIMITLIIVSPTVGVSVLTAGVSALLTRWRMSKKSQKHHTSTTDT
ncbi:hypothetical protein [Dyadobacter sp. 50-39]|uniref:hypothetical protein n=1 Tax=Dyadobacter sp. 50-39 TaxID=1895756 RepID=UPI0025BF20D6|nr:hypothetical protein [Dyadobacter sp. 50-39]